MTAHKQGGFSEEYRIVTPDGSVRWVSPTHFLFTKADEQVAGLSVLHWTLLSTRKVRETLRSVLARTQERYLLSRRIGAARTAEDVLYALRSVTTFSDAQRGRHLAVRQPWGR